jgi:hypothetical protein
MVSVSYSGLSRALLEWMRLSTAQKPRTGQQDDLLLYTGTQV